ncbi:hypothetical protein ACIPSE_46540 [Streptomyces sp. NPDC090106]|uniref:hypothetical protein n=1 Tax=Streptomyces sp. NPDC090106 TaxID=3365946 RepID=UPI003816B1C5
MPLLHDRAVIAATVLGARLRTACRGGRDPYDVFAHQQAAMPEQLLLFGQEERPVRKKAGPGGPIDVAALRTDLEALELTADQLGRLGHAGQHLATLRKDANWRADQTAIRSASSAQSAAAVDPGRQQHQQPGPEHGPGPRR